MSDPLPPLGLDDLRVAEPDRDSEAAFSPSETWAQACDAIAAGHKPADVAGLLLTLPESEACLLRDWWRDECITVAAEGQGRDALCPDLLLCRALVAPCGLDWPLPLIDPATVLKLLDELARLKAAAKAAGVLGL